MTDNPDNSKPAFPLREVIGHNDLTRQPIVKYHTGMTYREWLIGQALQGTLAYGAKGSPAARAEYCITCADAVLHALEQEQR